MDNTRTSSGSSEFPSTMWRHSNASSCSSRSSGGLSRRESRERHRGLFFDEDEEIDAVMQWLHRFSSNSNKQRNSKIQDQGEEDMRANMLNNSADLVYGGDTWDSDSDDTWPSSVLDDNDNKISNEKFAGAGEKAKLIVDETINTEQKYVQKLHLLNQFNVELETLLKVKKNVNPNDYLLPNIDPIYKLHHDHLLPALETVGKEWSSTSSLASAFTSDIVPFFNLYIPYIANLTNVTDRLSTLKLKYTDVKNKVEELQKAPEFGKLQIEMIMLEPFQKLPRYQLLLERYQKCVDESDKHQTRITEVLSEIAKVHAKVGKHLHRQDSFHQLHGIQDRIPGFMVLDCEREFICEGEAMIACDNLQKWKQCYLFLFTDLLLITSEQGYLGKHKVQSELSLGQVRLEDMPEDRTADRLLLIKKRQHVTCLLFNSTDDKSGWEDELTCHIGRCSDSIDSKQVTHPAITCRLFDSAPVWHPDSLSTVCMLCENKFTTLTRRHHCRGCGLITCGKCSTHSARIPYKDYKRERICDVCFKQAIEMDPTLLRRSERLTSSVTSSVTSMESVSDAEESGIQ